MRPKMATDLIDEIYAIDKAENNAMAIYRHKSLNMGILTAFKLAAIKQEAYSNLRRTKIVEYGKKLRIRAAEPSHNARRVGR